MAVLLISGGDPIGLSQRVVDSLYPPSAVTAQGAQIRDLYTIVFLIAVVIFFVVEGLIVWTVIRYRRKPDDDALPPQTHGNNIAEIVWTVVPTIIVAFLFVISWQTLNTVEAVSATPDTKIRAVAGQFQWTFEYLPDDWEPQEPGGAAPPAALYTEFVPVRAGEAGGLDVPAGRTVQLYLDSPDVIHAFYVPQFLFKRDVVPGRINVFEFNVRGRLRRPDLPRPVRRAVRLRPPSDAVHGPCHGPGGLRRLAAGQGRHRRMRRPPPATRPESPRCRWPADPARRQGHRLRPDGPARSRPTRRSRSTSTTRTPPSRTTSRSRTGRPGRACSTARSSPASATKTYDVPALAAGAYAFICTVHPNMTGTLTVN